MDRAPRLCTQIAQDKAYSVASFGGLPASDEWRLLESEPALLHGIVKTDRLVVFLGGIPLVAAGPWRDWRLQGIRANRTHGVECGVGVRCARPVKFCARHAKTGRSVGCSLIRVPFSEAKAGHDNHH